MPSSIALGCNGYEAYMQQILTPYGVLADTGITIFAYRNRQNQAKPSGKRKTISVFLDVFGSAWRASLSSQKNMPPLHSPVAVRNQ